MPRLSVPRLLLAAVFVFALAIIALPAHADAKPTGYGLVYFEKASSRYTISLVAIDAGKKGKDSVRVILADEGGDYHSAFATYIAPARVSSRRIRADLGSLGKVDLRMRPYGKPKVRRLSLCGANKNRKVKAVMGEHRVKGVFRFKGEAGWIKYRKSQSKFQAKRSWHSNSMAAPMSLWKCYVGELDPDAPDPVTPEDGYVELKVEGLLDEAIDPRGGQLALSAIRQAGPSSYLDIGVDVHESRPGLQVRRSAQIETSPGAFRFDRNLDNGELIGRRLMSGTGVFTRDGDATDWTGDLVVNLPGRPNIPLTGSGISAELRPSPFMYQQLGGFPNDVWYPTTPFLG